MALAKAGCSPHIRNALGKTALEMAQDVENSPLYVALLRNMRSQKFLPLEHETLRSLPGCTLCPAKFSMTNRKKQCRHCGRVVCGKCSANQLKIEKFGLTKPQKICTVCFEVLTFQRHI